MSLDESLHARGFSPTHSTRPAPNPSVGTAMSGHCSSTLNQNPPPGRLGPNHNHFPLSPNRLPLEHPQTESGPRRTPSLNKSPSPTFPPSTVTTPSSLLPHSRSASALHHGVGASPVSVVTASLEADDDETVDEELEAKFQQQLATRGWKRLKRPRDAQSSGDFANVHKIPRLTEIAGDQPSNGESSRPPVDAPLLPPPCRTFTEGPIVPADPVTLAARQILEVDEGFCDEDGEEPTWHDTSIELLRYTSTSTLRQMGPLRYRGSGQYTSRTQPVVRSKPRMRKRKDPPTAPDAGPAAEDTN